MNIYVATIPPQVTEAEIKKAFAAYGKISSFKLIKDMYTGALKGFGFIEMPKETEAEAAIAGLNGKKFKGKKLTVKKNDSNTDGIIVGPGGKSRSSSYGFSR
jgi:RNA recognition motif-containing protein